MIDSDGWIRGITSRAVSLWERDFRTAERSTPPDRYGLPDRSLAHLRRERWQDLLGDAEGLDKRLLSSSFSSQSLDAVLGMRETPYDGVLPTWASILEALFHFFAEPPNPEMLRAISEGVYRPEDPLPFQEVFAGFIYLAHERVKSLAGSALQVLFPSALADLERQLLAHLTFVANLVVGYEFYAFRFEHAPASAIEFAWKQQSPSTEIYSAFVQYMNAGGLLKLLEEYPVLAQLLCQSVEQWIQNSANLCLRFNQDFSSLRAFFRWKIETLDGAIARIRTDLSDRHHGGQAVAECRLKSGERIIYKPRTVQPEIAFYRFIGWLNEQDLGCHLKVLHAIDRERYGWVEPVSVKPCQSDAEVERFYRRAGMLLAVLHTLGVTDIHRENLISCGEHPVVVDLETLLSYRWPGSDWHATDGSGDSLLDSGPSVLSTGLLPRWQTSEDGRQFDMSPLGTDKIQDPDIKVQVWQSINTDQMMLAGDSQTEASTVHRVRLANAFPTLAESLPGFCEGFRQVYQCLLENRQLIMADSSLLSFFDDLDLRILVRNTSTYTRILLHLLQPEFLKNGIDRSIELDWLARPLSGTPAPSVGRKLVYENERSAMEKLDIPHFSTSDWKNMDCRLDDEDLFFLYGERDSRDIQRSLATLCPADCERQLAIIEMAVQTRIFS